MITFDKAFGDDVRPAPTFEDLVRFVRANEPRTYAADKYPSIIAMLEYMRDEQLKLHDQLTAIGKDLDVRADALKQREDELAIRARAVDMILRGQPQSQKSWWR